MNYKCIVSFTYLLEKRRYVSKLSRAANTWDICDKKKKDKNMFVWKPVTILKVHLYLNVRMK